MTRAGFFCGIFGVVSGGIVAALAPTPLLRAFGLSSLLIGAAGVTLAFLKVYKQTRGD